MTICRCSNITSANRNICLPILSSSCNSSKDTYDGTGRSLSKTLWTVNMLVEVLRWHSDKFGSRRFTHWHMIYLNSLSEYTWLYMSSFVHTSQLNIVLLLIGTVLFILTLFIIFYFSCNNVAFSDFYIWCLLERATIPKDLRNGAKLFFSCGWVRCEKFVFIFDFF